MSKFLWRNKKNNNTFLLRKVPYLELWHSDLVLLKVTWGGEMHSLMKFVKAYTYGSQNTSLSLKTRPGVYFHRIRLK